MHDTCPECGSGDVTHWDYPGFPHSSGFECRDCGHNFKPTDSKGDLK